MGLFDYALNQFSPHQGRGIFGNSLGQIAQTYGGGPDPYSTYSPADIQALIRGYGPNWSTVAPGDSPQIPADPSGSTPLPPQVWNSPIMPRGTNTFSAEPISTNAPVAPQPSAGNQATSGGSWIRPGSFLDTLLNTPGGTQAFAGAAPRQPNMSGAEPSEAWTGNPSANVPLPRPRPENLGVPPQAAPALPPPLNINPQAVNAMASNAAPPPQAAQPQPAPVAPQSAQPEFSIGDRLLAGASNFSDPRMGLIARLANSAQGLATGQRTDAQGQQQQNQRATLMAVSQSLIARGYSPQVAMGMAQAASIDPKIAEKILGEAYAIPKTAEELAVRQASMPGQGGNPADAFKILREKNAATSAGTAEGERVANAQLDLPGAIAQANEQLRLVQELRQHPGRGQIGWHDVLGSAPLIPSTKGFDAGKILDQLKSGAFLTAFQALKGSGAISNAEGSKATDAVTRMDRAQSKAEFEKALSDYEGVIRNGIDKANQLAGKPAPYGFKGNTEWQQVKPGVRIRQVQ